MEEKAEALAKFAVAQAATSAAVAEARIQVVAISGGSRILSEQKEGACAAFFGGSMVGHAEEYGYPVQDSFFAHRNFSGIKVIEISCGEWIDSLRVQYITDVGNLVWTDKAGGNGGGVHQINLEYGEEIVEVKGEYGRRDGTGIITNLTFKTNKNRNYGPFGKVNLFWKLTNRLVKFEIIGKVVGFHGTAGGFLSSIGCYTHG